MSRYSQYGQRDDHELVDGDNGFRGLSMRLDPTLLAAGYYARGENVRHTNNIIQPRGGMMKLPWVNQTVPSANAKVFPYGAPKTAAVFNDPTSGIKWTMLAADDAIYYSRDHVGARKVAMHVANFRSGDVTQMVQCFDVLICFRGPNFTPLVLTSIDAGFKEVSRTELPSDSPYLDIIPPAESAIYAQNRLFIPHDRDQVAASDLLDYTRYAPTLQNARINQGTADELVALVKFTETTVIAFKTHSIYALFGVTQTLNDLTLTETTREYGCCARKTALSLAGLCFFLAERRGVCVIRQTDNGFLQVDEVPLSEPIQPIIDRINWRYASGACAAYWDNRYYLALPLDEARWTSGGVKYEGVNNVVVAYNFLTNSWESVDNSEALSPIEFFKTDWRESQRLFAICNDGYTNLLEETVTDQVSTPLEGPELVGNYNYNDLGHGPVMNVVEGNYYRFTPGPPVRLRNGDGVEVVCEQVLIMNNQRIYSRSVFIAEDTAVQCYLIPPAPPPVAPLVPVKSSLTAIDYSVTDEAVPMLWRSRSYTCPQAGTIADKALGQGWSVKSWLRTTLNLKTWYPMYLVNAITEGANEVVNLVRARTKNRTKYDRPFDAAPWVPSNVNDDHNRPFRQDYSVWWENGVYLGSGVFTEQLQQTQEELRLGNMGRSCQIEIQNDQGVIELQTLQVDGVGPRFGGATRM